ncbi:phosphoribosylanthranilate isomerase [Blattabacterium cuenoti]|uniref:phosphoribosylanthranilate isomerase n=1 Tax=Blattabacterium cuenoti TaxID=1653831 RepID=UPI00163CBC4C|nr:phosphoribosylanthranilate isomerase [Blattabacterium cuenoti]
MHNRLLKIKICGLKYNINKISHLYPDFIGFIFYDQSPRFVGKSFSVPNIPKNIFKTGVFVNENENLIVEIYKKNKLDFIQLHGMESPCLCRKLFEKGFKIIKSFKIHNFFSFKKIIEYIPFCSYFLWDNNGGSGKKFQWERIQEYDGNIKFFLSGGISLKDIDKIKKISHPKIFGIDINSKFEIFPGKKNEKMLEIFIKEIRSL